MLIFVLLITTLTMRELLLLLSACFVIVSCGGESKRDDDVAPKGDVVKRGDVTMIVAELLDRSHEAVVAEDLDAYVNLVVQMDKLHYSASKEELKDATRHWEESNPEKAMMISQFNRAQLREIAARGSELMASELLEDLYAAAQRDDLDTFCQAIYMLIEKIAMETAYELEDNLTSETMERWSVENVDKNELIKSYAETHVDEISAWIERRAKIEKES